MTACTSPIPWATLVDHWADDLDDALVDDVEAHLLGCDECSGESAAVARILDGLGRLLDPVLSAASIAALRTRGLRVAENPMRPGDRREVVFATDVDLLVHRLGGLELSDVVRVGLVLSHEASGRTLVAVASVPFERAEGAVLLACQKHYAVMPPDTVATLTIERETGEVESERYVILHVFEGAATT